MKEVISLFFTEHLSPILILIAIFVYAYFTGNRGYIAKIQAMIDELASKLEDFSKQNAQEHKDIKEWIIGEFSLRDEEANTKRQLNNITIHGLRYITDGRLKIFAQMKMNLIVKWAMEIYSGEISRETQDNIITATKLAYSEYERYCVQMLPQKQCDAFIKLHNRRKKELLNFLNDLADDKINNKKRRFINFVVVFMENTISDLYKVQEVR